MEGIMWISFLCSVNVLYYFRWFCMLNVKSQGKFPLDHSVQSFYLAIGSALLIFCWYLNSSPFLLRAHHFVFWVLASCSFYFLYVRSGGDRMSFGNFLVPTLIISGHIPLSILHPGSDLPTLSWLTLPVPTQGLRLPICCHLFSQKTLGLSSFLRLLFSWSSPLYSYSDTIYF